MIILFTQFGVNFCARRAKCSVCLCAILECCSCRLNCDQTCLSILQTMISSERNYDKSRRAQMLARLKLVPLTDSTCVCISVTIPTPTTQSILGSSNIISVGVVAQCKRVYCGSGAEYEEEGLLHRASVAPIYSRACK